MYKIKYGKKQHVKPETMANNCRKAFSCCFQTIDCLLLLDIRGSIQEFERELIFDTVLFRFRFEQDIVFAFRLAGDDNDDDETFRVLI
jgi:hypothetical protein